MTTKAPVPISRARNQKRKSEQTPTDAATPPATDDFPLRVVLMLMLDGAPVHHINFEARAERPDPGKGVGVGFPVDARKLYELLERLCGPGTAKPAKLWTPGGH